MDTDWKLDISEAELIQIFNDMDDEVEAPEESSEILENQSHSATIGLVEIYLDERENEIKDFIDGAVAELNLLVPPALMNTITSDVCMVFGTKSAMLKKYAELLRKTYSRSPSDPSEIMIKLLLAEIVPKIIRLRSKAENSQEEAAGDTSSITEDDKKILKYLSGALLKWGLRNFEGDDAEWLRSQVSPTNRLSSEYQRIDRGYLISPTDSFYTLILEAEKELRKVIRPKSLNEQLIINSLSSSHHATWNPVKELLVRRFVRARGHMHWRRLLTISTQSKKLKRRSAGLRKSLKQL